jgi:hypothetical protein
MHASTSQQTTSTVRTSSYLADVISGLISDILLCDQIAQALVQCHDDNPFGKLWHIAVHVAS